MEIIVRNVEPYTAEKLQEMARRRGISRNELIRRYLEQFSQQEDLIRMEEKYIALVTDLADKLQQSSDLITENTEIMHRCLDVLDREEDEIC